MKSKIRIILRNLKSFLASRKHIFIHFSSVRQPCTLLIKSVLGLHLYYPGPWGGVDQWLLKM